MMLSYARPRPIGLETILFQAMSVLITIIFCFSSTMATMQLIYPYAEDLTQYKFSRELQ